MDNDNSQQFIEEVINKYTITRHGKGQVIVRPGDQITKVHYIIEGSVIQYDISKAGNVIVVNTFLPGSLFPLPAIINSAVSEYFFEADSPLATKQAPSEQLIEYLDRNPSATLAMLRQSYNVSNQLLRRMSHLMGGNARSRVLYELDVTVRSIGQRISGGSWFMAISENDLARRTGLSRETVNRTISRLKQEQLLTVSRQGIELLSIVKLRTMLENES